MKKSTLTENLTDFQKNYVDSVLKGNNYDPSKNHNEMFDSYIKLHPNRISFEMNSMNYEVPNEVKLLLNQHGYAIEDAKTGIAYKTVYDKFGQEKIQRSSIGKLLKKYNADKIKHNKKQSLLDYYNDSRKSANNQTNLVISRDKYDIASMSTNRNWASCMALPKDECDKGGVNHKYIENDLKNGSLVAYITKKGDDDIEKPLGRIAIKKYISSDGKEIYRTMGANTHYGNIPDEHQYIDNILKKHYPAENGVSYKLHQDLYSDGQSKIIERNVTGLFRNEDTSEYYNDKGQLNDYIDELGNPQPAVIKGNSKYHYVNGKLHHYTEPSVDEPDLKAWYLNGIEHREGDEPSYIEKHINGLSVLHRKKYGIFHHQYEPSFISNLPNGDAMKHYYLYGKFHNPIGTFNYTKTTANGFPKEKIEHYQHGLLTSPDNDTPASHVISHRTDTKYYYNNNGEIHRENDLPAYERIENNADSQTIIKSWYKNGKYHREDHLPTNTITTKHNNGTVNIIHNYYDEDGQHKPISENTPSKRTMVNYPNGDRYSQDEWLIGNTHSRTNKYLPITNTLRKKDNIITYSKTYSNHPDGLISEHKTLDSNGKLIDDSIETKEKIINNDYSRNKKSVEYNNPKIQSLHMTNDHVHISSPNFELTLHNNGKVTIRHKNMTISPIQNDYRIHLLRVHPSKIYHLSDSDTHEIKNNLNVKELHKELSKTIDNVNSVCKNEYQMNHSHIDEIKKIFDKLE